MNTFPDYVYWMDLLGTFIFAITGGFRAIKYELNILGVMTLATAVGVGGGMTRDVLLGLTPPAALQGPEYLITTCFAGVLVFFFALKIAPSWRSVLYADAFGLAVFAAIGAEKAYLSGLGPTGVMVIAIIASCGGGVIRDILTGEIPYIFTREIYASAALIGGFFVWLSARMGIGNITGFFVGLAAVLVIRIPALRWDIKLPKSKRLPASPSEIARSKSRKHQQP